MHAFKVLIISLTATLAFSISSHAQIVASNPLEVAALIEGNELTNAQYRSEMKSQAETAALQGAIAAEFTQMKSWQDKYNDYLKTASGYASQLKAGTQLYNEGVRTFLNLTRLKNALTSNPQDIVASVSMNDLFIETATELVSVFTLLKEAVATGGKENMITCAERSKILWALDDRMAAFNRKLSKLSLSIRYYTMNDVWMDATAGMVQRSNGEIASAALGRWKRASHIR